MPTADVQPKSLFEPCPECGSDQTLIWESSRRRNGTIRRRRHCKSCQHVFHTVDRHQGPVMSSARARALVATTKHCSRCKRTLPIESFGKKANDDVLYRSSCRECLNLARSEHGRRKSLAEHGLTIEQYEAMVARQDGRCAICGTADPGTRLSWWCVDHCHDTGRVRGLLCNSCNLALGNFKDDPERMANAIRYLDRGRTVAC